LCRVAKWHDQTPTPRPYRRRQAHCPRACPSLLHRQRTDGQKAGIQGETVIDLIEKGLIVEHPFDRLALAMRGRAVLKAILPEM
jgi:hypothetical protein